MNIVNKKIYYKYFDLYRLSKFLGDNKIAKRAYDTINILATSNRIDLNKLDEFTLFQLGLSRETVFEILEYQKSGKIQIVDLYKKEVAKWIQSVILQDFFDIDFITAIIKKNNIKDREHLVEFFRYTNFDGIDKDKLELYIHFLEKSNFDNFPHCYSCNYDSESEIISFYQDIPILGSFHNHSTYSDGKCSIQEIVQFAKLANREYVGISDHTKQMGGITEKDVLSQHKIIDEINQYSVCNVLKGVECEILKNGELDLNDWVLKKMDYVIIAIHTDVVMMKKEAEHRLITAIENEYTSILAHPSSRILNKKVELFVDMYKIIDACIANNVIIEINGDPSRLDLDPKYIKYALEKGAIFSLDADTHTSNGFKNINNAIQMALDSNIPSDRIINTFDLVKLKDTF